MRSFFRWACILIGLLAFVLTFNELILWMYRDPTFRFLRLLMELGAGALSFIILLLMHNAETYPARERAERYERELEQQVRELRVQK